MATIMITGGTGMIGTELTKALVAKGHHVIVLTRNVHAPTHNQETITYSNWDTGKQQIDLDALRRTDYIIHLAGAGIAGKRWTRKRKKEILESRTKSSALLVKALRENPNIVKALVSASAIGWYGEDKGKPFVETDPSETDFLGQTCRQWEESIEPVGALGIRLVKFRTGIVLAHGDGALKEFLKPLRFGVAAILGSGKQFISWIHISDLVRLYIYALEKQEIAGVYNVVAPQPVTNKTFTLELARQAKGKYFVPVYVPGFVLKMVLGEMSIEVLKSARVSCHKIQEKGFQFEYPSVGAAFKSLRVGVLKR